MIISHKSQVRITIFSDSRETVIILYMDKKQEDIIQLGKNLKFWARGLA